VQDWSDPRALRLGSLLSLVLISSLLAHRCRVCPIARIDIDHLRRIHLTRAHRECEWHAPTRSAEVALSIDDDQRTLKVEETLDTTEGVFGSLTRSVTGAEILNSLIAGGESRVGPTAQNARHRVSMNSSSARLSCVHRSSRVTHLIMISPSPVAPHPPQSESTHAPEPAIGASPTRPGTLCDMPFVDVPAAILPFASMTTIAIVS
jgi:hypothetical protein